MAWRGHLLLSFCLAALLPARAQPSEGWLPVTTRDLQVATVPGDPGASAIQLYYADFRDDVHQSEFIYQRMKVLKGAGESYANVEIEVPPHSTISGIEARTIHPDKTIVEFTGKPFEKIVARYRGEKVVAKAFTLPAVTVGSLVEYKYRLYWTQYFKDPTWILQHQLFTVRESFWLRRYKGPMPTRHLADQTLLSYVTSNLPPGVAPKDIGPGVELEVENVPAFKPEPYMPPPANFKPQVQFFYGGREIESPDIFWREIGQEWYEKAEHFIGNHEAIKNAAAQIIGSETDPEQQLQRLYARAQQIRNLSLETESAGAEGRAPEFKPNENVLDVMNRGYGSQNEIAELFAGLARAAGFSAQILRTSDRRNGVFDPKMLSERQLESEIVRVTGKGSDLFLDPGTRFCPFGLVAWTFTSAPALQLDKSGGTFVVVPTATADKSVTRRSADLVLTSEGSVRGEITVEFKGNEALERRLQALNTDDAGRRESLEAEMESWLPAGASAQLESAAGWESSEPLLVTRFSVRLANFGTSAGGRLAIPASLFRSPETEVFTAEERKYPVYFPFTYEVIDKIDMTIPSGYRPETIPDGQDARSTSTRFITTRAWQGQKLRLTRALVVNSIYFQPAQYGDLRKFFNTLRSADDQQIVLAHP